MTQQERVKGNKLIAEFMNTKINNDVCFDEIHIPLSKAKTSFVGNKEYGRYEINGGQYNAFTLKYHLSWDWLMPVIEKICKLEIADNVIINNGEDSFFDSYYPRTFGMINSETKEFMVRINRHGLHQSSSLIEATYSSVVEFIKHHNQKLIK